MNGCRLDDHFEPVGKLHTLDDLWQLVVAIELAPGFLRAVDQLEDQGKRRLVGEAALRAGRPVAHGGESAFDPTERIDDGPRRIALPSALV